MNHLNFDDRQAIEGHSMFIPVAGTINPFNSVARLVVERPERARVFDKWHLAYCCGEGNASLINICARRNIAFTQLLLELQKSDEATTIASGCSLERSELCGISLTDLANHAEDIHHSFIRHELPRLSYLMDRVVSKHGAHFPELWELQDILEQLKVLMELHLNMEEQELFPWIKQLELMNTSRVSECAAPELVSADIGPHLLMRKLMNEHTMLSEQLESMRTLTNNFVPPDGACTTYRVLLQTLAALKADVMGHFAEEEEALFPRAIHKHINLLIPQDAVNEIA